MHRYKSLVFLSSTLFFLGINIVFIFEESQYFPKAHQYSHIFNYSNGFLLSIIGGAVAYKIGTKK